MKTLPSMNRLYLYIILDLCKFIIHSEMVTHSYSNSMLYQPYHINDIFFAVDLISIMNSIFQNVHSLIDSQA